MTRRKRIQIIVFVLGALVLFLFVNNSSLFARKEKASPLLLAHRGLAQTFPMDGIGNDTCTAERIYEPEHPYLENTIPSMEAAFQAGADIVEFDVHPTKDGQFAVFHDWTLDCRTDAAGTTRNFTMQQLKQVDIGYGYTADQGKTFPFRGKGVGMMPSLTEVLHHFPGASFLIHVKSSDPEEGQLLADALADLPEEQRSRLAVYGGGEPIEVLQRLMPDMRVMSKETMKQCLLPYVAIGWTGYVPESCRHTQLHIPEKIAPWLWGWPHRFLDRMNQVDARVILVGGDGSDFSTGFDSPTDLQRLPPHYSGGIWTNRIDRIGLVVPPNT